MKIGDIVKIADVGTPAKVVAIRRDEMFLELDGERFWIQSRFVEPIIDDLEDEAA